MKKINLIVVCLILIASGLAAAKARAGWLDFLYTSKDILTVAGNKIFLNKKAVWLKGVAMGDPHSRQTIDRRTVKDYETIKQDWLANVVRLSIHPGVFRKDQDKSMKILEKEVTAARGQGLFVIIDWHVIGMPNGWYKPSPYGEDHFYSYSSNFNTAREFWKLMAVKFRGDRAVLFELWNEPADPKINNWKILKPYMQRLYGVIRGQGADNLIIVPGVWWTYDLRGIKNNGLAGNNLAYAWHNYPSNGRYLSWSKALDGLNEKYPIVVSEWGYETGPASPYYSKSNYATAIKQFIVDKRLHFTAWVWHGGWKPRLLTSDWKNPSDYGKFVKDFLKQLAGK